MTALTSRLPTSFARPRKIYSVDRGLYRSIEIGMQPCHAKLADSGETDLDMCAAHPTKTTDSIADLIATVREGCTVDRATAIRLAEEATLADLLDAATELRA